MKIVHTSWLPVLAATFLACGHNQTPPPGSITREQLPPMVETMAQQVAPAAQRTIPIYEGATAQEDGRLDWSVPLQPGQCYTFVGIGGWQVKRLFLYLWNPKESRVATAKPDRPQVTLRYCPVEAGLFHLQAKSAEGYGVLAVGVYGEAGAEVPPPPPPAPVVAPAPQPPPMDLSAMIDSQAAAAAPGAARVGNFFTGNTEQGDRSEWPIALEAGRCYWFVGAGDPTVRDLSLYLWNPANKRLTENRSRNNQSVIGHCPKEAGMYKVQAKVEKGKGAYQMGIYAR